MVGLVIQELLVDSTLILRTPQKTTAMGQVDFSRITFDVSREPPAATTECE